jgi:hypothetical protein
VNAFASIFQDLAPAVDFGWAGRLYVVALLVGVPFLALLQPSDREMDLPPRSLLYASAVIGIWLLAIITALILLVEDRPLSAVGLKWTGVAPFVIWTVVTAAIALVGDWLITRLAAKFGLRESRLTYHLMPRNRRELTLFMGVSASAGFGEEFTYHGFLLAGLAGWLGNGWIAALVANLSFGVLHGYQGQAGVVRAALMGYVFCLPVVTGAGLLPAMAGHFLVNALLGLGLWKWLLPPGQEVPEG